MNRQVRTWKESKQARGTHFLKSTDQQTSQDMKRIQANEGHSLPGERRWMDKLEHRKNLSNCRALTNWRVQTHGQVRTWKGSEQARGTHQLESMGGWTSQDMERI